MEQPIIFSSPVQSDYGMDNTMAVADECEFDIAKAAAASSSRSPTCVIFAVDERLDGVFRVSDHRDDDDYDAEPRRPLEEDQQGELSTFSEDTDESSSSSGDDGDDHHHRRHRYLPTRRRLTAPLMSIFRPTSGTKRRCDFEEDDRRYRSDDDDDDDDHEDDDDGRGTPTKPPSLRHANPVGSGEYGYDAHDAEVSLSSTFSYASAFKRRCRSISSSSYSSLLVAEEEGASAFPLATTIRDGSRSADDATAVSTMTILEHLQHPLSSSTTTIFENIEFRYPKEDNEGI